MDKLRLCCNALCTVFFMICVFCTGEDIVAADKRVADTRVAEKGRQLKDRWYKVELKNKHGGYIHISTKKVGENLEHRFHQKLFFATGGENDFIMDTIILLVTDASGKPVSFQYERNSRMPDGRKKKSKHVGRYSKGGMRVTFGRKRGFVKWPAKVYGFWNIEKLIAKEEKRLDVYIFGTNGIYITKTVFESKGNETVKIQDGKTKKDMRCLKWDVIYGKKLTEEWRTADGLLVKRRTNLFGPHKGIITLSTKKTATKVSDPPDLWGFMRFGDVKGAIDDKQMRAAKSIVYSLTLPADIMKNIKWSGERQKADKKGDKGTTVILKVKKVYPPGAPLQLPLGKDTKKKFAKYLSSNKYLESDNSALIELAGKIRNKEKNSYKVAINLAKWVFKNLKKQGSPSYSTALGALKQRRGDCSEHSVLFAALLRAAGIPSRVVFGMAYKKGGFFVHMWTEVFVGKWVSIDAHWGQGNSDVGHIALRKSSLKSVKDLSEIMKDATSIGGRLRAEILKVSR